MAEESHSGSGSSLFSSVVAIIAFIILIVIVLWGLVHLTSFSRTWLGSLFSRSAPTIAVTVPKNATSSEPFNVTWKYTTSAKGTYAFLYQCKTGLQIQTAGPNNTPNLVPCGAAYTIPSTNSSFAVTPLLSGTTSISVPVSIIFLPSATSTSGAQGSATVAIHAPASMPSPVVTQQPEPTPSQPAPSSVTVAPKPAQIYRAPADLAVRIVAVGVIDPSSGAFVNRPAMSPQETAAVQFDISNVGGAASGAYYFEARLPTLQGYTYESAAQSPLGPGDHVLNTLRFTQANPSGGNVYVTITTEDANNVNNDTSQWMNGGLSGAGGYGTYNYYPVNYQSQQQYQYVPPQPTYYYPPQYYQDPYQYQYPQYQY